ncbi:nitrile hydratase accessory protein [Natronobeatus ordinarius]|uniref:nitrile hydratase accessory protein n=1 Tax=Natronobeatus ordinarius TaxID=2963433 RepID=UPI0020CE523A|nr:nitrile hydratase accessory protein [Natronobeatus ordinarius]
MVANESDADALAALELEGEGDEPPTFHAPWQARAFAVAVALSEDGTYEWPRFQERLVEELERAERTTSGDAEAAEDRYYRGWLAALERLLVEDAVLEAGALSERTRAFTDGDRDASEWVEGDHGHEDGHIHGHEH